MGESTNTLFRPVYGWSFAALPSPRTPDCWPAASWLGLTETASECLQESRGGRNVQHRLVGLLKSVYSRLAGYEATLNGWPTDPRCG